MKTCMNSEFGMILRSLLDACVEILKGNANLLGSGLHKGVDDHCAHRCFFSSQELANASLCLAWLLAVHSTSVTSQDRKLSLETTGVIVRGPLFLH